MKELVAFCAKFGIEREVLASADSHLNFRFSQTTKLVENFGMADVKALTDAFGQCVDLSLMIPPVEQLKVEHGEIKGNPEKGIAYLHENPDLEIDLRINVDKKELLKRYLDGNSEINAYLFLFEDALLKYLGDSVVNIDSRFFQQAGHKTLIVLPDLLDPFMSPNLLIAGLDGLTAQVQAFKQVAVNAEQQAEFLSLPKTTIRWDGFVLRSVVPTSFMAVKNTEVPWLNKVMDRLLLYTFLLFTANRSTLHNDTYEVNFYGLEQTRTVKVSSRPRASDITLNSSDVEQMQELIRWLADGSRADRLTIFQKVTARELAIIEGATPLAQFVKQLPDLLEKSKWNYSLFIDDRMDRHFDEVKAASSYFSGVAQSIAQKVDSMTKSMTETFLGAIGVVVVSFLASYINQNISGVIFSVLVTIYALFILLVQIGYRMAAVWSEAWALNQDFEEQKSAYKILLTENTVNDLTRQVLRRKKQFRVWFWITVLYYAIIVIALVVAAYFVPLTILYR